MAGYDEDYSPERNEAYGADSYFLEVQREIKELYEQDKNNIFYIRQLQVKFEKKYLHWITNNALQGLRSLEYLRMIPTEKEDGTSRHYYMHRSNRYPRRKIKEMDKIIDEYSKDNITRSCGQQAENLFCLALLKRGFRLIDETVNEFRGKRWEETGHNLDFVFERDGIHWGCEIKNTLSYIDKEELRIKLEMCNFFNIHPLFIMRNSPTPYNWEIIKRGGCVLIFETQIYDMSQGPLVDKIKQVLGLPVDCPRAIPEGIIDRFENRHKSIK